MATVKRINVVFLYVTDLSKVRQFYEAAFDLDKPVVDAKWWIEYAIGDGSHLALHQVDPQRAEQGPLGGSSVKFSIEVEDIHAFVAKLKKLGAIFHFEPRQEYGFWLAEFEDIEGNPVRLYEKARKPKNA
ncbi:VOC family protein [bacterium]|nr:VOC family protein [bacterium]